jgi:hypothetical protein
VSAVIDRVSSALITFPDPLQFVCRLLAFVCLYRSELPGCLCRTREYINDKDINISPEISCTMPTIAQPPSPSAL